MPHPGLTVATNPRFNGRLAGLSAFFERSSLWQSDIVQLSSVSMNVWFATDIESEFKKYLQVLIPGLLAPQNLVIKEISGQKVKAKELLQYFKSYIEIYKGDELPEPKSMLVVSTEFSLLEFQIFWALLLKLFPTGNGRS